MPLSRENGKSRHRRFFDFQLKDGRRGGSYPPTRMANFCSFSGAGKAGVTLHEATDVSDENMGNSVVGSGGNHEEAGRSSRLYGISNRER